MTNNVLEFLNGLAQNNNREWFQANKRQYDAAKAEVEKFVNTIIPVISGFDESIKFAEAKDCMFRIFRDVRFSKDKSPYKLNMGAWISAAGRKSSGPGYYLHLQPGESFAAIGVYMPEPEQLKLMRKEIYYNIDEFLAILQDKRFTKYFGGIDDWDKAKLPPKDFPKDFAHIDLLKNRHYIVSAKLTDDQITDDNFLERVTDIYKSAYPLNTFLRRALEV